MSKLDDIFGLKDKVCFVTGASVGIGRAVAIGMAEAGADVVITSRVKEDLDLVAESIRKIGRRCLVLPHDMNVMEGIPELIDAAIKEFGRIDVLVNNAGMAIMDKATDAKMEDFDYQMNVNVKSIVILCQQVVPHMRNQGRGKIINVSSTVTALVPVESAMFNLTKGSINQLTRTLAVQLARERTNIQVNGIAPGAHRSRQMDEIMAAVPDLHKQIDASVPMGRFGQPEEIVGTFLWLAGNGSDYVTGQTVYVDGGWTVAA